MKIAVIGPRFFGYSEAITEKLNSFDGVKAVYFDERPSNTLIVKILIRLRLKMFLGKSVLNYHSEVAGAINLGNFDVLLSLDSESLSGEWLESLNCPLKVFYMWDSLKNKPVFSDLLSYFNVISTFDPKDAERLECKLIHLFAEEEFSHFKKSSRQRDIDLVFVGTLHSIRVALLKRIRRYYEVKGHFYYHGRLLFLIQMILNGSFSVDLFGELSTRQKSKFEIAELLLRSKGVIDIAHPGQSGLTSRTFESLRAGCVVYSNNAKQIIAHVPKEFHGRVRDIKMLLAKSNNVQIQGTLGLSQEADYWLSIERFCEDILLLLDDK
mgnify:CR=1 FL=1